MGHILCIALVSIGILEGSLMEIQTGALYFQLKNPQSCTPSLSINGFLI